CVSILFSCKLLIPNSGTFLASTQDVMRTTAKTNSFLPQFFLLNAVESLDYRRVLRISFIQRVINSLTAAGFAIMSIFLDRSGENNDELFGTIAKLRPNRPNQ